MVNIQPATADIGREKTEEEEEEERRNHRAKIKCPYLLRRAAIKIRWTRRATSCNRGDCRAAAVRVNVSVSLNRWRH